MARVSIIDKEEMLTVKLGGYMDTPSTPDVEKGLEPLLTKVDKDVLFDCIDLDYIDEETKQVFHYPGTSEETEEE